FPATQRYFDSWLGQVMTYIFRIALMATVLSLAIVIFNNLVSAVDLESDQNTLYTSLLLIGATVVLARLLDEMNTVSGQLAGGMSLATLTFGRMVAGATSPLRVAGNTINRQSTRRDMQSGMMVTGGRLNHLAAGNTMWNPAYRQHVMQNMGKNWGPAAGGKTSKERDQRQWIDLA
ncbi:type IV secretion system protein, partial [Pseudomonas syringae]